ncbi:S-adenosyl-L-methionine-dependent methyltransferase [Stipitochalara longipes BDJ]|nr:S-adenosyl-L-methionine-dependent methyltransferase [Stipitochalara longipes BDJ]
MGSSRPIQSVTNAELYNRWAKVYDTDGNILQSVDDLMLPGLLDQVFTFLPSDQPITVTELGCGTGRNTVKLLARSFPVPQTTSIAALDLSPRMLAIAKERCEDYLKASTSNALQASPDIDFHEFDALNPGLFPDIKALERKADLVLSTLVLEHLPLDTFFRNVKSFLKPASGYILLTNMHADMGCISQAGFVDEVTGEKIRGHSYAHEISEVIEEGEKWGFEVVGEVGEKGIEANDIGRLVGERGKKWVGVNVWFGFVMRFAEMEKRA